MPVDSDVYLGFGEPIHPTQAYRLKSHYFPLGKIGGKPAWLNPKNLPSSTDLACTVCKQQMAFLVQIYCSNADDPQHAFHTTLFVFLCKNKECSKENDRSNLKAFRCQLPQVNSYYPAEKMLDPDMDSDVEDPMFDKETYPNLCEVCGCSATKKCGKCSSKWYCCKEHQAIDWKSGHHNVCGKQNAEELANVRDDIGYANTLQAFAANAFVFKEYEMEIDIEYLTNVVKDEIEAIQNETKEIEEGEEEDNDLLISQMREMKKLNKQMKDLKSDDVEDIEEDKEDISFKIFHKLVSINSDQILRYKRKGNALLATDLSPFPADIPKCSNCGADRLFEFQLMPHLLSLIDVTLVGKSIDWASIYVYTCSKRCEIKDQGYLEEYLFKQDFVLSEEEKKMLE